MARLVIEKGELNKKSDVFEVEKDTCEQKLERHFREKSKTNVEREPEISDFDGKITETDGGLTEMIHPKLWDLDEKKEKGGNMAGPTAKVETLAEPTVGHGYRWGGIVKEY
jgi:hypothetical protein